jgi:hypothetical protein
MNPARRNSMYIPNSRRDSIEFSKALLATVSRNDSLDLSFDPDIFKNMESRRSSAIGDYCGDYNLSPLDSFVPPKEMPLYGGSSSSRRDSLAMFLSTHMRESSASLSNMYDPAPERRFSGEMSRPVSDEIDSMQYKSLANQAPVDPFLSCDFVIQYQMMLERLIISMDRTQRSREQVSHIQKYLMSQGVFQPGAFNQMQLEGKRSYQDAMSVHDNMEQISKKRRMSLKHRILDRQTLPL